MPPVLPRKAVQLKPGEELPDMEVSTHTRKGHARCAAVGLYFGDCTQPHTGTSIYCYYHDKLRRGLTEPTGDLYPVWPLPGYRHRLESKSKPKKLILV